MWVKMYGRSAFSPFLPKGLGTYPLNRWDFLRCRKYQVRTRPWELECASACLGTCRVVDDGWWRMHDQRTFFFKHKVNFLILNFSFVFCFCIQIGLMMMMMMMMMMMTMTMTMRRRRSVYFPSLGKKPTMTPRVSLGKLAENDDFRKNLLFQALIFQSPSPWCFKSTGTSKAQHDLGWGWWTATNQPDKSSSNLTRLPGEIHHDCRC